MSIYFVVLLMFIAVSSLVFFVLYLFLPQKSVIEERVEELASSERPKAATGTLAGKPAAWERFFEKLGRKIPLRPQEYGVYTKNLVAAGFRKDRLPVFLGSKLFFAIALPLLYFFYGVTLDTSRMVVAMSMVALGIFGYVAPSYWLSYMIKKRQLRIFQDLPDVLDLITVCVEAGLSMDAAMVRIAESQQFRDSPLAKEMRIAIQETRAGLPRHEAIRDMGERTGEEDLKSFAAMLVQTERLGTSLAESLRVHSDSLRVKRRQVAEERAAKTSVKLLFPLVFLLLPAMFVVVLLPSLIRMAKVFAKIQ